MRAPSLAVAAEPEVEVVVGSLIVDVWLSLTTELLVDVASLILDIGSTEAKDLFIFVHVKRGPATGFFLCPLAIILCISKVAGPFLSSALTCGDWVNSCLTS